MRMLKLLTRLTRLTMFIITFCWLHQNMIGNPQFVLNPYMFKGRYVPSPFKGMVSAGKGKVSHTCTLGIPVNNPSYIPKTVDPKCYLITFPLALHSDFYFFKIASILNKFSH